MGLLDSVLGGGSGARSGGGMSPITMGLLGLLAYRTFLGKGRLADMLGRTAQPAASTNQSNAGTSSNSGLGGLLSGLGGGGILSGGLTDLLNQFQQNGHGDKASSWVSTGVNRTVAPSELESVLGGEKITWLMNETGLSRDELLTGLSKELPRAIDKLTPEGRIPTGEEVAKML